MPISEICSNFICKTDFGKCKDFMANIAISCISESGDLQLEQQQFPVFWQNLQIPCVFPDRDVFWPFSLFSLISGDPITVTGDRIPLVFSHTSYLYHQVQIIPVLESYSYFHCINLNNIH